MQRPDRAVAFDGDSSRIAQFRHIVEQRHVEYRSLELSPRKNRVRAPAAVPRTALERATSSRPHKPSKANPRAIASRSWRASLIRKKGQVLGDVEAPNREAAEAEAVRTFNLSPEQRSQLVVQERG
jgi:hypothetical protein